MCFHNIQYVKMQSRIYITNNLQSPIIKFHNSIIKINQKRESLASFLGQSILPLISPYVLIRQLRAYTLKSDCMNQVSHHINIILITINTIGLTAFSHQYIHNHLSLALFSPFLLAFLPIKLYPSILHSIYCLIAVLGMVAAFLQNEAAASMVVSVGLGLALCLGYHQVNKILLSQDQRDIKIYEGVINISLALGVFLSAFNTWVHLTSISAKLLILITTLANFYLPIPEFQSSHRTGIKDRQIESKMAYSLSPFYIREWSYAIGYAIGIYINTFKISATNKHIKYLFVGLLLMIEALTYKTEIKLVSELLRGIFIYHFQRNHIVLEAYFIFTFLCLRLYFHQDELTLFLMVSYVILALYLWKHEYQQSKEPQLHQQLIDRSKPEIQMSLIKTGDHSSSKFSKSRNSIK